MRRVRPAHGPVTSMVLPAILAAVMLLLALAWLLMEAAADGGQEATQSSAHSTQGALPNAPATTAGSAAAGSSGTATGSTATVPADATPCPSATGSRQAFAGSVRTNCGFAAAVLAGWDAAGATAGAKVELQVRDPLTGEELATNCLGQPPIICLAAENRIVYLR